MDFITISIAAIGSFTTLLIYLLRLKENRIKDRREKAALFLAEIDIILHERSKFVTPREWFINPPKKLGAANYEAFRMTLNRKQRKRIENAYQNCQKDYNQKSFHKLKDLIIEIANKT
jgi:hypothetical protein